MGLLPDASSFEAIFHSPAIPPMMELTPTSFELFVQHVFERAGYVVEYMAKKAWPLGSGFDLHLHRLSLATPPVARVECRRYDPAHSVYLDNIQEFIGTLEIAGGNIPGYIVTTSTFHPNAIKAAQAVHNHHVALIDGEHLTRYIRYVQGSRAHEDTRLLDTPISPEWIIEADHVPRFERDAHTVLGVCNNKGGVGKTTSSLNIGLGLASPDHNQRVLLIDMDGQGNLSYAMPLPTPPKKKNEIQTQISPKVTLVDYFLRRATLAEIVVPTNFPQVWLVPAHPELAALDLGGGAQPQIELAFAQSIHDPDLCAPDGKPFDWILLDTPTTQSTFTRMACAAAHVILIPSNVEPFAKQGITNALNTVGTMGAFMGTAPLPVAGLLTKWPGKATSDEKKIETDIIDVIQNYGGAMLRANSGDDVLRIPTDPKISKAHQQTINGTKKHLFSLSSGGSDAYLQAAKELFTYARS